MNRCVLGNYQSSLSYTKGSYRSQRRPSHCRCFPDTGQSALTTSSIMSVLLIGDNILVVHLQQSVCSPSLTLTIRSFLAWTPAFRSEYWSLYSALRPNGTLVETATTAVTWTPLPPRVVEALKPPWLFFEETYVFVLFTYSVFKDFSSMFQKQSPSSKMPGFASITQFLVVLLFTEGNFTVHRT